MGATSTYREKLVKWTKSDDAEFPYTAEVDGRGWTIRVNDFPVDPFVYTLLVEGDEVESFNDWPYPQWQRPDEEG